LPFWQSLAFPHLHSLNTAVAGTAVVVEAVSTAAVGAGSTVVAEAVSAAAAVGAPISVVAGVPVGWDSVPLEGQVGMRIADLVAKGRDRSA
jgi:hypothetical protein